MQKSIYLTWCLLVAFALISVTIAPGCREAGPAEEAGREVDRGIEDLGREVEDLGRDIEDFGRGD